MLDHNDDGSGRFTQWTAYLVRVDERFRGLDSTQKEVFIDPGSFGSCYTHYEVGKQYLFVAGGPPSFAAMSVTNDRAAAKPIPERWASKGDLRVYSAALCSPTREADKASEDIAWLRARERGTPKTRVFGLAMQNYDAFYRPPHKDEDVPLPGARVILEGNGQEFTTFAGHDGRYSFEAIPPGSYHIFAEKRMWTTSRSWTLDLYPGSCAQRDLSLGSAGEVRGTLVDHEGRPVNGVRVELVRVLPETGIAHSYTNESDTDSEGRFELRRVAGGTFVLGVNIGSAPTDAQPYRATFYPGAQTIASAHRFTFGPNARVSDLVLRLPQPLAKRKVTVQVYWADGSPVESDARAFADYGGHRAAFERAPAGNAVGLVLLEGLNYEISADWFSLSGAPMHHVRSGQVSLPAGRGPATIDIRLKARKP